jgi:hypothetical protein
MLLFDQQQQTHHTHTHTQEFMKCENALQPLPANAASLPLHCYNVHKEISNQAASKYIDPAGCAHSGQLSCAGFLLGTTGMGHKRTHVFFVFQLKLLQRNHTKFWQKQQSAISGFKNYILGCFMLNFLLMFRFKNDFSYTCFRTY